MTKDQLRQHCIPTEERDGFDQAYYDGILHVLDACGDGGISFQYIAGITFALTNLDEKEIEGEYNG